MQPAIHSYRNVLGLKTLVKSASKSDSLGNVLAYM